MNVFHLRQKSLPRGIVLALGGFFAALAMAGFPNVQGLHRSRWEFLALALSLWGMVETGRCLRRQWNLYHAGVMILLYAELMILAAIVALLTLF